jgi:hypothetical protein
MSLASQSPFTDTGSVEVGDPAATEDPMRPMDNWHSVIAASSSMGRFGMGIPQTCQRGAGVRYKVPLFRGRLERRSTRHHVFVPRLSSASGIARSMSWILG